MGRLNRNSLLFDAATIAKKPAWLRAQLAALGACEPPPATIALPDERKPRKARAARLDSTPRSKSKPSARNAPDEHPQIEAFYPSRVLVRVESRRCGVQCDPDNIVVKWHIDALRYARILSDDTCAAIDLRVTETRVATRKEEGVEILITPIQ